MTSLKELKQLAEKATPIPDLDGYFADIEGNIYTKNSRWYPNKLYKMSLNNKSYGYIRVTIKRKHYFVHRLICRTFIGESNLQVCHNNGIRDDNRLSNLRYGTAKENAADRSKHGNCKSSENGKKSAIKNVNKNGGVHKDSRRGTWYAVYSKKFIGSFKTKKQAKIARKNYLLSLNQIKDKVGLE